jgi:threonine dehydrogenase-like Zn-dependent dehydrogenase
MTMLAGRLNPGAGTFEMREVPVPEPGPGQVRVRVRAAGVCLSDVHLIDGSLKPSFLAAEEVTLGHEVAGDIDVVGPDVPERWQPGTRVVLAAGQRCGECPQCLRHAPACVAGRTRGVDYDGGWAEYTLASHHTLFAIPDGMPYEQAAIVPDAVSTPWGAVAGTGRAQPGRPAGVWGVGGLGAHAVQLLRIVGAAPIIAVDPLPAARDRALRLGADLAFDPADPNFVEQLYTATDGVGLDVAYDMAGVGAVRAQAVRVLAAGGRLVLVGLTPEPLTVPNSIMFTYRGQQVIGNYGSADGDIDRLLTLCRLGRLDLSTSISGTLPLAEAPAAVQALTDKKDNPIRLILVP